MATVGAWWYPPQVCKIIHQLSSHEYWKSMVLNPLGNKHAPSVVIVWWQRSKHGDTLSNETCSVSFHHLMTMVWAWWYPLRWEKCSISFYHPMTMVIKYLGMKHAPSAVIVSWQQSEHGDTQLRYELCSVTCQNLMTTVRACFLSLKYETCSVHWQRFMTTVRAW